MLPGVQRSLSTSRFVFRSPQRIYFAAVVRVARCYGYIRSAVSYLRGQRIHHNKLSLNKALVSSSELCLTDSEIDASSLKLNMSAKVIILEGATSCASGPLADIFSLGCIFFYMTALHARVALRSLPVLRTTRGFLSQANIELLSKFWVHLKNSSVRVRRPVCQIKQMLN